MTRRRSLSLAALLVSLLAFAAPAQGALANHPFLFEAGAFPSPTLPPPSLEYPEGACGVALDSSAEIYLADYYHDQILVFNPEGEYRSKMAGEEPLDGPCGLALDPAGNLYVNNFHRNVVKYPSGNLTASAGAVIDSGHSTGVAVDPATGNLFVDDRTYIAEYEAPVEPGEEAIEKIGLGNLEDGYGVAVSDFGATAGYVYVPDAATATIKVYDPATSTTSPVAEIDGRGTPQAGFNDLVDAAVAVDDSDGHLFVLDNVSGPYYEHPRAALDEFNLAGDYRGQLPEQPLLIHGEPSGVAVEGSSGDVYVTSGNSEGSSVFVYGPTAPAYLLQVAKSGAGAGTVTSEPPGVRCGTACAAEFDEGAQITLTATAAPGSEFLGWSGAGCAGKAACQVTMSEAHSVNAEFAPAPASAALAPAAQAAAVAGPAAPSTAGAAPASGERRSLHRRGRRRGGRSHHRRRRARRGR
jgi:DNA-binding beta-propeller fold protein YncE